MIMELSVSKSMQQYYLITESELHSIMANLDTNYPLTFKRSLDITDQVKKREIWVSDSTLWQRAK